MQFSIILALAGLGAAMPGPDASTRAALAPLPEIDLARGEKFNLIIVDPETAHNNMLKHWNPENVIHSDDLQYASCGPWADLRNLDPRLKPYFRAFAPWEFIV